MTDMILFVVIFDKISDCQNSLVTSWLGSDSNDVKQLSPGFAKSCQTETESERNTLNAILVR